MSKKLPPPREVLNTFKTELEMPLDAPPAPPPEVAEVVDLSYEAAADMVNKAHERTEKKRKALIAKALSDVSAKKLREILAERITLGEALKLAEIE